MVQKYTSSDFDLFNKIDLSEDSNKYKKKSSIKKDISEKPISSYLNKDKHKFDLLESHLGSNKPNKNDGLFFSQNNIDDYSDFKKMNPHNIKNSQIQWYVDTPIS